MTFVSGVKVASLTNEQMARLDAIESELLRLDTQLDGLSEKRRLLRAELLSILRTAKEETE